MKFLAGTLLTLFVGLMFVSLFSLSGSVQVSHGSHGMGTCPFMMDQEVLCGMSVSEHLSAWKSVFSTAIPSVFALFLTLGTALLLTSTAPFLLRKPILRYRAKWRYCLYRYIYSHAVRPLQELFSSGILHPKLF